MIEWNRVTWYSKALAIVLFLFVFAIAFYLGSEYEKISAFSKETEERLVTLNNY